MTGQLERLAAGLAPLAARLRAQRAVGVVSSADAHAVRQLLSLRINIASRLRQSPVPSVALLDLDRALADLEAAFLGTDGISAEQVEVALSDRIRAERVQLPRLPYRKRARPAARRRRLAITASVTAITYLFTNVMSVAASLVVPDGSTQTSLAVSGNTTDVTTSTIKSGNAYNSFSQFQVGQPDTVNLHVPDAAQRLINVVHGGPVNIDGVVNGYKDGKIGGDVYFADPYGFVVGKTGSVNVGSLTVRTPTAEAAAKLIDSHGNVDDAAAADLVDGLTPISPDGAIVIRGRINAPNGVHLSGQSVSTSAAPPASGSSGATDAFDATVNTSGLQQGGQIVASNGDIEITAAGDAAIGGTLSADGTAGRNAGHVSVTAGGTIALDSTTRISARGDGETSNGGNVKFQAGRDLNVAAGARVDAGAGRSGDGGDIELSAAGTARIEGASLNTAAPSGKAGAVTIDPADVVLGGGGTSDYNVTGDHASIDSGGANVTITASNSITLVSGAFINTRQTGGGANDTTSNSTGNSGNVSLSAPNITIAGSINAFATNANNTHFTDGNITLTASGSDSRNEGLSKVDSAINISGTLNGGIIDVEANATASSSMSLLPQIASTFVSSLFGAGVGYVDGQASATITVSGSAKITGSGDVTLNAWTDATAADPVLIGPLSSVVGSVGFAPAVVVGNVTAKATSSVASGAALDFGGTLTVRAHNTDTINVSTMTVTGAVPIDASVAYTTADVESSANVAEGATVKAQNAVITARNDNDYSTSVTVVALGTGAAGIAAAIADGYKSTADAHFGPSVNLTGPATGRNLSVEADSFTDKDNVSASTTVGSNLVLRFFTSPIADALSGTQGLFAGGLAKVFGSLSLIKFGAALALTLDEQQSSKATLGGDAAHAPVVNANTVSVTANTRDEGVRSNANAAVNSPNISDATPANPTAVIAVSAGVAIADRSLSADAEIGSGASVTAPQIGVFANTSLPITITWLDGDSFNDVMSHINGNLGVVNDVLTTFTDSTADAGVGGVSGSVNLFNAAANSTAFVGQGATLSSLAAPNTAWSATLDTGDDASHGTAGTHPTQVFDSAIAVLAQRSLATINFGGNFSIFFNGIGGASSDAASFGATYESVKYSGDTDAGIGAKADVESNAGVSVKAIADDKAISVSPAAGNGGGVAFSGMVALFDLDSSVHASVADSAKISGANVDLLANQNENIGTVAGAILVGNANSVGAMETTNTIDTDVQAYIGDNSGDDPTQSASLIPAGFIAPVAGVTTGGALNLAASEIGLVQSLAVSVDVGSNAGIGVSASVNGINDHIGATLDGASVAAKNVYLNADAGDTIYTISMGAAGGSSGPAVSGSAASATIAPTIAAEIKGGATVAADDNVGVLASNNDEINTIAGNAAISLSSAGIGVSVVVNQISGSTQASISGPGTTVDANGGDPSDTFAVNSGALASAIDVSSVSAPSALTPSLAETQKNVSGLAVVSTSHQAVAADAATLGVGRNAGVALIPITTVIASTSNAFIDQAAIDTLLTGDLDAPGFQAPQVEVIAGNHTYTGDFVAAIAGSMAGLAGAGAASTVKFQDVTKAYVQDATIGNTTLGQANPGALDITAGSTQETAVIVLGGAGGMSGGAASLAVTLFSADTEASLTGGNTVAGALNVGAVSDNGANVLDGAAAIAAAGAGVGGSIAVTTNNDTTLGYVGDLTNVESGGTVDSTILRLGTAAVAATTNNDLHSLLIAGAGGFTAGIAGIADVTTLSSTTKSGFYGATMNAAPAPPAGAVSVAARENDSIDARAGAGAAGGVGFGVAANVVVLHAQVTGTVLDSAINSAGAVSVSAEGDKSINALTVTGAVGYYAGVSAAIGVVLAGTDASSDVTGQLADGGSGTLGNVSSLSGGASGDPINSGSPDAVTASLAGGSVMAASLALTATAKTATSNQAVGVAAGGLAGVGGAVAYSDIGDTVVASLDTAVVTVPSVSLLAQVQDGSGKAISVEADAGGGGAVGIGAGVAIAKADNNVGAHFAGSATGNGTGNLSLTASDSSSGSSTSAGGAAGGVAVGVMVGTAEKHSTVSADTANASTLSAYQNVSIQAGNAGSLGASATGVSGGVLDAANAAAATANDVATVNARLGTGTSITGNSGLVTVSASDTPQAGANAFGVAVSGSVALGASVALVSIAPTVTAALGDNVHVTGAGGLTVSAVLTPVTGQTTADAEAFAGTGGALLALNGVVATASDDADVEAVVGANAVLPMGDAGIAASNISNQNAFASGIGVGGLAGGASYAEAESDSTTKALLGDHANAGTGVSRSGTLTVSAIGNDTNTSHTKAGTYGLVAGNASVAQTVDNSTVTATIADHVALDASDITLKAAHQDNYSEFADSTEVSVLGASGAGAEHDADVAVKAEILANTDLIAHQNIDIGSENDFLRIGTDDAADAGGGGVLNGAGATSKTAITGSSSVAIGDSVTLVAGNDPIANPGRLNILASSAVGASDIVSLSTGGALEGAGTANDFTADVDNDVSLGAEDTLLSFGNINIGTDTTSAVTIQSLGSTWGVLGAVADATADLSIVTNQTVALGANDNLLAFGNINLTPGQDPASAQGTNLSGGAQAETYVRGLVAVPDAYADSDLTNNAKLTVAAGTSIRAGENATLGAYDGMLTPTADGTGHGYELGFIPVTDGGEDAAPHTSSTVVLDGDVTAGAFHDVAINVADCQDTGGFYCGAMTVTGGFPASFALAPAALFLTSFSPTALISHYVTGTQAQFLGSGVSSTAVDAISVNTLFASAGSVTLNAASLSGHGTLTANGEASITVNNDSPDYLLLGAMQIPDTPGGHVIFTGGASSDAAVAAGIGVQENNPDGDKSITVANNYTGAVGNSSLGPAIFVTGGIENLGGSVHISAPNGSLAQFSPIVAQNVIIDVPQGVLLVDLAPGLLATTGPSVIGDWSPFMTFPGGNPAAGVPNADLAIAYAVNAVYNPTHAYTTADGLSGALDFTSSSFPSSGTSALVPYSRFGDGKNSNGASIIVYGTCLPTGSGDGCAAGAQQPYSPVGTTWAICAFDGFRCKYDQGIASVPSESLSFTAGNITAANETAQPSAITANKILVHASYIDIDSDITAGTPTNWSVSIPASVQAQIDQDQQLYATHAVTDPKFDLSGATVVGANDSLIHVSYVAGATAADGRIVVDNVLASAQVAASITLDGGILSTNTLGRIHVNAGLGQVNIDNQTDTPLTLENVSAGNSDRAGGLTGTVEIIDRLSTGNNHSWYVYTPGQGTDVYVSSDPNATIAQATQIYSGSQDAFTFNPVPGLRWAWQQTAFLSRTVTSDPDLQHNPATTHWQFTDPTGVGLGLNANQPWYYTDTFDPASAVAGSNGALFLYNGQVLSLDPAHSGQLLTGQSSSLAPLVETITGTTRITHVEAVNADCIETSSHCSVQARSDDFPGFVSQNSYYSLILTSTVIPNGYWDFDYITGGTVTLTTSVKADNPIGIDFSGSTRGHVTITSNATVAIDGQIVNPNGDTGITASSGDIVTTTNGGITSNNLILSAASGAIGSAVNPLNITVAHDGDLSASGDQGVFIAANSGLNINQITAAHGDVLLNAEGSIELGSAPGATAIIGNNVTLMASQSGNIGAVAPITTAVTGKLDATAEGRIAIEQVQGDLSAGTIRSSGIGGVLGDVSVTVDQGALLDAANTTSAQTISDDQLQSIWKTLKLTVALGAGANVGASSTTVAAVENTVNGDYQQYWLLLSQGQAQGGIFTLNPGAAALYQAIAAAANLTPQQYAQRLYNKLAADFAQYVDPHWQSTPQFQAQVAHFSFTPPQAQIDALNQDAVWTEGELKSALSLTALQPSTSTDLGTTTPNVAGRNLDLDGADGIGSLAAPVTVTLADLKAGNLTPAQERAIALAKNPGELTFVGQDSGGNVVRFNGAHAPAGVTITAVEIKQTAPLFVNAGGTFDATAAQGGVFVQATAGDLNLGKVEAGAADISLAAPHSILAANGAAAYELNGGGISLLAGTGDLGSAAAPLIYEGTQITSASAAQDIYLRAFAGNFAVGRIFAGQDVSLDAPTGGIQPALDGTDVIARNLALHAGARNIGSAANPLQIQLASDGALQGSASGAAVIAAAGALQVTKFTTGGNLTVTATGDLNAKKLTSTAGSVVAAAGGVAGLSDISAKGSLTGTAVNNLTVSGATSGGATSLTGADVTLSNVQAGGTLSLKAIGNLMATGLASIAGDVTAMVGGNAALANVSASGGVSVSAGKDVQVSGATSGGATAISGNTLTATNVQAGSGLTLKALGDLMAAGLASITGDLTATVGGNATLSNVSAHGGVSVSAGKDVQVSGATSGGATAISSNTLTATNVQAGSSLTLKALGNLVASGLTSIAGDLMATVGGNATLSNVSAHGGVSVSAANALTATNVQAGNNLTLSALGNLVASKLASLGSDIMLTVGGSADLTGLSAHNNLSATSGGALSLNGAVSGKAMALKAGGDAGFAKTLVQSGDAFSLTVNGAFTMASGAVISAAKQVSLAIGGNALLGRIESLFNADQAITVAADKILGNGDGQTNIAATGALARTTLTAQHGIGAQTQYLVVDTPWLKPGTVSGGIYIHALSNIVLPDFTAPGDLQMVADHDLTAGAIGVGGAVLLTATHNLVFTDLKSGGAATLSAGNSMIGNSLTAGGAGTIMAGAGSFQVKTLSALNLSISSLGDLNLPDLHVRDLVSLSAPNIIGTITQTGSGPLTVNIAGQGGPAQSVKLTLNAANGVSFGSYSATDGTVLTDAGRVDILKGHVADQLLLVTPFTDLYFNNQHPTPVRDVTEQFYAPSQNFFLNQDGTNTITDAFAVNFGDGFSVTTLDAQGHAQTGFSLVRTAPLALNASTWSEIFAQQKAVGALDLILADPAAGIPELGLLDAWVASVGAAAVNTGGQ